MAKKTELELTREAEEFLKKDDLHHAIQNLVLANDQQKVKADADPSVENRYFYGITFLNLAAAYKMLEDSQSYKDYARSGISVLEKVKPEADKAELWFYLSSVYQQLGSLSELEGDLEAAEDYYLHAVENQKGVIRYEKDSGNPEAICFTKQALAQQYIMLTGLYQQMEQADKYKEMLGAAVRMKEEIAEEFDTPYNRADFALGQVTMAAFLAESAPVRAEELYRDSIAVLERETFENGVEEVADVLVEIYKEFSLFLQKKGDLREATTYYGKYTELEATRKGALDAEVADIITNAYGAEDPGLQNADRTREELFPE